MDDAAPVDGDDGADVAGVLRSWEDRFGAYVVAVGFATLDLVVTRPPGDAREALVLAQEHYAFCPDVLDLQDLPPAEPLTVPDLAEGLQTSRTCTSGGTDTGHGPQPRE